MEYRSITVGKTNQNYIGNTKEKEINYRKVTFIVFRHNCFSIKPISSDVLEHLQCKNVDFFCAAVHVQQYVII
jgi:hypothetical protein